MPEHQKAQKKSQKIQHPAQKKENAERKCGSTRRDAEDQRGKPMSIRTEWRRQKWRQSYRACRQKKKEEAPMLRKQVTAVWRKCYKGLSHWGRMEWRSCSKESEEKWERPKDRCQEKKEEGTVKLNKSKAESVSSWCYQRQAGLMKARQRVVWSLIFLVFGVHLANANGRGRTRGRLVSGNGMRKTFVGNEKKREIARVRTQGPSIKTAKVGTSIHQKETARVRTRGP